jgi:fructokinase
MARIAGLGELLWDVYPDGKFPGGAPANFALHAHRLGHEGIIMSRVGQDAAGKELLAFLKRQGLNTSAIQVDEAHPTGTVRIELDARGIPTFFCSRNTAFDYLTDFSAWLARYGAPDAILTGTLAQRHSVSRKAIWDTLDRCQSSFILFDVNLRGHEPWLEQVIREMLHRARGVKVNREEAVFLVRLLGPRDQKSLKRGLRSIVQKFRLDWICVTLGEAGAFLLRPDSAHYAPGYQIDPVDTTGAGDAFLAALMVFLLEGYGDREALRRANAYAALVCTHKGAVPEINRKDLELFLYRSADRNIEAPDSVWTIG